MICRSPVSFLRPQVNLCRSTQYLRPGKFAYHGFSSGSTNSNSTIITSRFAYAFRLGLQPTYNYQLQIGKPLSTFRCITKWLGSSKTDFEQVTPGTERQPYPSGYKVVVGTKSYGKREVDPAVNAMMDKCVIYLNLVNLI